VWKFKLIEDVNPDWRAVP